MTHLATDWPNVETDMGAWRDWANNNQEQLMPLSASEAAVEAEIKTKGLKGIRIKPVDVDAQIAKEHYWIVPLSTTTVCALTLKNGYVVIGESACADPLNFDVALGQRIARDKAREKIWALEGYLLREMLDHITQLRLGSFEHDPKEDDLPLRKPTV